MTREILSRYLAEIERIHATRAGTGEVSYYGALVRAFDVIGAGLKPRVFCVPNLGNRGAGFPDMGLFAGDVSAPDAWPEGRPPERGVVEVDDIEAPLQVKLESEQVVRYLAAYGLVLVTNFREFVLLGRDANGGREVRERFDLGCPDPGSFFALARSARRPAGLGTRFAEFLERVLLHQAPLGRPEDVAFFLCARRAGALIRERPILVVLGNPPYNAFAGTSPAEESGLVAPYKEGLRAKWGIRKFNLDDLYVRFFRVAEGRIAEETGRGVVCFISNHSWLSMQSYVVMRERLVQEFDCIWIDNLNGSKFETGKVAPDGSPDPSVFSTDANREGIQVGTAIALLVRKSVTPRKTKQFYRDFWGTGKRALLLATLDPGDGDVTYVVVAPSAANRFSLRPSVVADAYAAWPKLPDLAAIQPLNGLMEKRGGALIDDDRARLEQRMRTYFDPARDWESVRAEIGGLANDAGRFPAKRTRENARRKGVFSERQIVRYFLRPFDLRWTYTTPDRPIWNEPRPELLRTLPVAGGFLPRARKASRAPRACR
ncbi:MAG: hypothetical protein M0002_04445 [Rhodospirillales bacterium]|nr:hypothetical protein [Rhodospirillales bacterium]